MNYKALATCIGSFPHPDPAGITAQLLAQFPSCPTWVQLPRRSFRENMYAQFATALPGVVLDAENERVSFGDVASDADAQTAFYAAVLEGRVAEFAPKAADAVGFETLLAALPEATPDSFIKGHITGPVSFGLTVTDDRGRAALHDPTLRDILVQGLGAQARAQCRALAATGRKVILFIDEPYLSSFGSATVALDEDDVLSCLGAVCEAVLAEDAIPAVHCCGNTDWGLLTRTPALILNFDAYDYVQGLTLYPKELAGLLDRDGALAWGIVPTEPQALEAASAADLADGVEAGVAALTAQGLDRDLLRLRCLVTPACGLGTLREAEAERAISLTAEVARVLRDRWAF